MDETIKVYDGDELISEYKIVPNGLLVIEPHYVPPLQGVIDLTNCKDKRDPGGE